MNPETRQRLRGFLILAVTPSLTLCAPMRAGATAFSGGDLLEACSAGAGSQGEMVCNAYVSGFVHGAQNAIGGGKVGLICLPSQFTPLEARGVYLRIMRTLEGKPAFKMLERDPAQVAIGAVLASAFPCQSRPKIPE